MNKVEKLIAEIRKLLFPYHHEHDIGRSCERWKVENGDCLTSWMIGQLANCRQKNRCSAKGLCAYYSYSDIAKKNYEICREIILLLENGEAKCVFTDEEG